MRRERKRDVQAMFGRATTLYPRSIELLEQLDLTKELCQVGFIARSAVNYRDGQRVNDRGRQPMFEPFRNSFHDYALNIRQYNSEEVILAKYQKDRGKNIWFGWALENFVLDSSLGDGYNITASLKHRSSGNLEVRW